MYIIVKNWQTPPVYNNMMTAKNKGKFIDRSKHLVLESAHPSPFSAYSGFFGSKPFSQTNEYLKKHGLGEIDFK